ncbi:hypothetical protein M9H77_11587 [Catharanthus roseus]|uniref:Uncharacterized protein n=1 Tax=Catharanthus roseus TaxID=4058 RepID=A0ACC0BF33_CATRO|nr:hypothetical protein M9H77_11587 [Catharanthus roseus]
MNKGGLTLGLRGARGLQGRLQAIQDKRQEAVTLTLTSEVAPEQRKWGVPECATHCPIFGKDFTRIILSKKCEENSKLIELSSSNNRNANNEDNCKELRVEVEFSDDIVSDPKSIHFCAVLDLVVREMDDRFTKTNLKLLICRTCLDPRCDNLYSFTKSTTIGLIHRFKAVRANTFIDQNLVARGGGSQD